MEEGLWGLEEGLWGVGVGCLEEASREWGLKGMFLGGGRLWDWECGGNGDLGVGAGGVESLGGTELGVGMGAWEE